MEKVENPLELMGVPGSPYTRKMLALLRYRRIPYRLIPSDRHRANDDMSRYRTRPQPKVHLLPIFFLTNEEGEEHAVCDSTPLIRRFENSYSQYRKVIPNDASLAFIDYLIEDYADEWLTKAMFHYRWSYHDDIKKAGQMLPRWNNTNTPDQEILKKSEEISQHQISRLRYVGSNEITRSTIEESFLTFLDALNEHLKNQPFILGNRPAASDFAVYGQLTCLALFDPTPQKLILDRVPRVYAWTEKLEDLSGYEVLQDDWLKPQILPDTLINMILNIGALYGPYLKANAIAVEEQSSEFEVRLAGRQWRQRAFPYQKKCLNQIQEKFDSLSKTSQNNLIEQCEAGIAPFLNLKYKD